MSTRSIKNPRLKPTFWTGIALTLALSVACSSGTSATSSGGASAQPAQGSTNSSPKPAKRIVIGWSQRGIAGSDWWKTLIAGGQSEAAKLGAKLEVLDANRDTSQQNQDVQTLITKGVDVVIMNPQDPLGVAPAVHALHNAKIPLVVVNSNLDPSLVPEAFCYVAEDQVATGEMVGREIAKDAIKKFGTSGTIKLVGIGGYPGDVISELRYKGFMQGYKAVMAGYPNVKTVELPFRYGHWLPDQALQPIRDVATANPDLKVVYSESDVMQAGIEQALREAGLWNKGILEGSYDGGMNAIKEMVENPSGPLQADGSNQPWDQGVLAVKMAVAAANNDRTACPGGTYYIKTTLVTPENAKQYYDPTQTYVRAGTYG